VSAYEAYAVPVSGQTDDLSGGQTDEIERLAAETERLAERMAAQADEIVQLKAQNAGGNRFLPTADSIRTIGGLVVVAIGVLAITILAVTTMAFIGSDKDGNTIVPLSTAAFGVISTIVGAYLGIKIGTDQTKTLAQSASEAHARLSAIQPFVPADKQAEAQDAGQKAVDRVSLS